MHVRTAFLFALLFAGAPPSLRSQTPAAPRPPAVKPSVPRQYSLSPARRAEAVAYSRAQYVVYFLGVALSAAIYLLFWFGRVGVAFRKFATRVSSRLLVEALIFAPLFALAVSLLLAPLDYYSDFVLDHRFGLSAESRLVWLGDWTKGLALTLVAAIILVWLFYAVARRSPRRWWFYFWLATIPLALFVLFVEPYVVEPLFFRFTPLARTEPALAARIEEMLGHAGLRIPPSRILEMNASAKTRTLNAYVSGLGTSKRVVVWDTTLKSLGPDETLLVLGHEMGHYVLHHIPKQFALDELALLVLLFLAHRIIARLARRVGPRTGVQGVGDLASLPLVMVVVTLLAFLAAPFFNGVSRHYEHQADQYGLEVAHGIVPDSNAAAARSFQAMGELDLADPDPGRFITFWLYTHPPMDDRIRFALAYHPWEEGKPMEFVRGR